MPPDRKVIIDILSRAASDQKFLARLVENPYKVLQEYDLTPEEMTALVRGDVAKIESWVGKLDNRLKTWISVKGAQDKWW
ncbi:MAG: hypothetical protein JSV77_03135 [Dehalococcoidales bacterium]|nr:MAG: hypothetical protein JSV77_03135 [Dehalococcoidales bacterium]